MVQEERALTPDARCWTGGSNTPATYFGRCNATWPCAELRVELGKVELTLKRPLTLYGRMVGADPLAASPKEVSLVAPVRLPLGSPGVAFRKLDGSEYYFLTFQVEAVLTWLEWAGFPVSRDRLTKTKAWSSKA